MATTNVDAEVKNLIADIIEIEPDQLDPEAHLVEDLDMDSMMALEILAGLEKKFKINIPEEDLPKLATVSQAVELTKRYLK